jgi:hypothetical protein
VTTPTGWRGNDRSLIAALFVNGFDAYVSSIKGISSIGGRIDVCQQQCSLRATSSYVRIGG